MGTPDWNARGRLDSSASRRELRGWHRVARRPKRTAAVLGGLVAFGLLLRFVTFNSWGIVYDGAVMSVMGESFALHGEFLVPYAAVPTLYHHYPPLYPMYLSLFYRVLGFSIVSTKVADLVLSAVLVAVVWFTTRDFLGPRKAWYAAAFVSLEPMFLMTSLIGYSEELVGICFVLTAWAAVKGLRDLPYLALAGLFAGLGFLAKASIGWVFVVTLVMGFLWIRRTRGWWILRDKWFLTGTGIFVLLAGGWTLRNLAVYGWPHWDTSTYLDAVYSYGIGHPALLAEALVVKVPLFLLFFLLYGGLFLPELRLSRRAAVGEATGLLWTIIGSTFLMGWMVSSFFWTVEQTPLWWWDNLRYVVITAPLILWLVLRETEPRWSFTRAPSTDLRSFSKRFAVLMAVFLAIGLAIVAFPAPYPQMAVMQNLDAYLQPGAVVGVDGISPETILPYISVPNVSVIPYHGGLAAAYILSATSSVYSGFIHVTTIHSGDMLGEAFACSLWARAGTALADAAS
ncbi:MAG TPA: glycosyltransferase family 39 protein [Thermoplasmata archaeon]|nr:glycosyltransferase family 39 protein [Thermoplasmata archaeon]